MHRKNLVLITLFILFGMDFRAETCSTKWSLLDSLYESFAHLLPKPSTSSNPPPDDDYSYKYEMTRIQNRMMSVALRTVVDFIISSGALEFSCSKVNSSSLYNNTSNVTYHADALDCQRYYSCNNGNQFTHLCEPDEGFDIEKFACAARNTVPLCQLVHKRPDFNCSSSGLQPHDSACNMFILCANQSQPYEASCNIGDFFDHSLFLCLPSSEAEC